MAGSTDADLYTVLDATTADFKDVCMLHHDHHINQQIDTRAAFPRKNDIIITSRGCDAIFREYES